MPYHSQVTSVSKQIRYEKYLIADLIADPIALRHLIICKSINAKQLEKIGLLI